MLAANLAAFSLAQNLTARMLLAGLVEVVQPVRVRLGDVVHVRDVLAHRLEALLDDGGRAGRLGRGRRMAAAALTAQSGWWE